MAQKQNPPRVSGSFLDRKYKEASAKIAGRGRRTIFTATDLTNGASTGAAVQLLSKELSAKFFQSRGDSTFLTFHGRLLTTVGSAVLGIILRDENDVGLFSLLLTGVFSGGGTVNFYGDANIAVDNNGSLRGAARLVTNDSLTPQWNWLDAAGGVVPLTAKKLKFQVYGGSGHADGCVVDFLQAEFSPGVIS